MSAPSSSSMAAPSGGGGSAVAAPICRDVLLEAQRRDPARRVPQPEAMAEIAPDRRAARTTAATAAAASNDKLVLGIGRRELTLADKLRGIQWGLLLLIGLIAGIGFAMLYSAANGDLQPWASRQMIRFAIALRRDDRGRAYRHRASGSAPPIGSTRSRWCWSSRSICAALSAWGRSAGSTSALSQLQPSELMKIALVLALARYFHCLPPENIGRLRYLIGAGADDRRPGGCWC